jgi:hypothetical protein
MNSIPKVTIVIGLPGSGKTTYLNDHFSDRLPNGFFDDFHGGSLDGTGAFATSRHYEALKRKLKECQDCVISDIEYCRSERLRAAEEGLRTISRDLGIAIEIAPLYFENNPNGCRHNVVHRFAHEGGRDYLIELLNIDDLTKVYNCPATGVVPVKSCCCKEDADHRYCPA